MTLFKAEIKSVINLALLSSCAYNSAKALNSEFDQNTKSTREAVLTTSPDFLSLAS